MSPFVWLVKVDQVHKIIHHCDSVSTELVISSSFMKHQKEYEQIGWLLAEVNKGGKDRNTVIAYGGGSFNHASVGGAPTPIKHICVQLKKQFRV